MNLSDSQKEVLEAKHKLFALEILDIIEEEQRKDSPSLSDALAAIDLDHLVDKYGFTEEELRYQAITFMLDTVLRTMKITALEKHIKNLLKKLGE